MVRITNSIVETTSYLCTLLLCVSKVGFEIPANFHQYVSKHLLPSKMTCQVQLYLTRMKTPLQHLQGNFVYIPHHLLTVLAEKDFIIFPLSQRVIRIKIIN